MIDNQIDAVTGTVRCKAVFPNSLDNLWPGQFVMVAARLRVPMVLMEQNAVVGRANRSLARFKLRGGDPHLPHRDYFALNRFSISSQFTTFHHAAR